MRVTREDELAMAYSRGLDDGVEFGHSLPRKTRKEKRAERCDHRVPAGAIPESSHACCVHSVRSSLGMVRKWV